MSLASDYRAITDGISIAAAGPRTLVCASLAHRRGGCLLAPDIQADIRPPGSLRKEKEERRKEEPTVGAGHLRRPPVARYNLGYRVACPRGPIVAAASMDAFGAANVYQRSAYFLVLPESAGRLPLEQNTSNRSALAPAQPQLS